jgi:hypothetical protein
MKELKGKRKSNKPKPLTLDEKTKSKKELRF